MGRRILVLSASVGAGHMRAAQAVELALREIAPDATVQNIDVLTLTNAAFRRVYGTAYLDLVNKAPHVLGFMYDYMDTPREQDSRAYKLRLAVQKLNLSKFCELIECDHWDVVIDTHFLPAEIIANLRTNGKTRLPQITVTTDFETHRLWVNNPCELYCTATEEGAAYLRHWGIADGRTEVTGIPIHPEFTKDKPRDAMLAKHGLTDGQPIVLQLAGGFGVGPIEKIYRGILNIQTPLQIIVVAGKNESAREQLTKVDVPNRHRSQVIGFTTEIDELMLLADVVVSKPGGLTTSEVLARGAAMAIVNPIPGQESRNSDFLLESGAAIKVNNIATLPLKLGQLLADRAHLQRLKQNARRIAKPNAAFDVARLALQLQPSPK